MGNEKRKTENGKGKRAEKRLSGPADGQIGHGRSEIQMAEEEVSYLVKFQTSSEALEYSRVTHD